MFETGASSISVYGVVCVLRITPKMMGPRLSFHARSAGNECVCNVCNRRQDPHGGGLLIAEVGSSRVAKNDKIAFVKFR
jgi:hypothetical protein